MPFTAHDTAHIIRRVNEDLADITETVREADPGLVSLVLTGGFARGEGSVRDGQPQNDYDLVAIRRSLPRPYDYPSIRAHLEWRLGLHIDLAPVSTWRLRWTRPSIFWYETALRGRVLYGPNLLDRIRVRDPADIARDEGLRLLANRSAGLLLATRTSDPHERRLQAAKALLAALDARLLAAGHYAPSQTERWEIWRKVDGLATDDAAPGGDAGAPHEAGDWFAWAYRYKVSPDEAVLADPDHAWRAAAHAIRTALPVALRHAGLGSLDDYAAHDGTVDRIYFLRQLLREPRLWPLARHPSSRVRVATIQMLLEHAGAAAGQAPEQRSRPRWSRSVAGLDDLERLRRATLQ